MKIVHTEEVLNTMAQVPRKDLIAHIQRLQEQVQLLKEELAYEVRNKILKQP